MCQPAPALAIFKEGLTWRRDLYRYKKKKLLVKMEVLAVGLVR